MANTYTQMFIQVVFAVKGRKCLLPKEHRQDVFKYMAGVIQERGHKSIIINGMADHVHIFIGLKPSQSLSELVNHIKTSSTKFIKKQEWGHPNFSWQKGFGAFSYSKSHIERVYKYIQNQEQHHRKKSFQEEYLEQLNKFEVEYDEQYLFEFY